MCTPRARHCDVSRVATWSEDRQALLLAGCIKRLTRQRAQDAVSSHTTAPAVLIHMSDGWGAWCNTTAGNEQHRLMLEMQEFTFNIKCISHGCNNGTEWGLKVVSSADIVEVAHIATRSLRSSSTALHSHIDSFLMSPKGLSPPGRGPGVLARPQH